jgi:glycosyltransferase involved in cell wall biosynthesis
VVGFTHSQTAIVLEGRLRAFVQAGFRVVAISSRGELLDRLRCQEGVETIALPMERGIAPLRDLISLVRLCMVLRRLRPTVTEFGTPKAGLLGCVAAALCGVPRRVYLLRGLRLETAGGWKRILLLAGERAAAACSHAVLCNSRSLMEQARALGVAPESKLRMLGRGSGKGVDVERFRPSALPESMPRPGRPVIGYVGRLTRDKGVPELIDAFNELLKTWPAARLHLIGWFDESDDALTLELRRAIDTHPAIVRTGFVSDTADYYRDFDMLVLPTWREGFPNVALEAAASGVPLITTCATGARDAVLDGETGIVVPPGDSPALLRAMLELASDPAKAHRMGGAARAWVLKTFVDRHVQALAVSFYRELCYEARTRSAPAAATGVAAPAD